MLTGKQHYHIKLKSWAKAIQSSFDKNPELFPDCCAEMIESAIFAFFADRERRKLWKTHIIFGGYFKMKKGRDFILPPLSLLTIS
jgi:hypothetical protein